jgi:hypothetical protein
LTRAGKPLLYQAAAQISVDQTAAHFGHRLAQRLPGQPRFAGVAGETPGCENVDAHRGIIAPGAIGIKMALPPTTRATASHRF